MKNNSIFKEEEKFIKIIRSNNKSNRRKNICRIKYCKTIRKMSEIHITIIDSKLFQDIQIEAFCSFERDYKVDCILFQINTLILRYLYLNSYC